ncbi:MAG TPA: type II secretion system protein [Rubrivivax sp.]|nr:type II secretion system protein [Rubrivivax sp.]
MRPARAQAGFGMLEAIVALVLFALVGSTLFAWIDTNLAAASRLRQREHAQHQIQLATAWLQTRNPLAEPSGEAEPEPGTRLRWQARAVTPLTPGAPFPGGSYSPFRLRLYELEVTVSAADAETHFVLRRLGHERDPVTELLPTR